MERKIFHGNIKPVDIAQALLGEFNRGNLRAQTLGQSEKMVVQVGTRPDAMSGGQTAMTVTIQKLDDGVIVELGQQAWLGVAASLGVSALSALKNPFSLLGRLDDIAQDIENLTLSERIWQVIAKTARAANASTDLSEKLRRLTCEYCHAANPVGEPSCVACGAPLGKVQPNTCGYCGYVVKITDKSCPNCKQILGIFRDG
ncbi:MAG: zinc ribbon domain-containing protein [Anaerolineales bacterium]|nr:MAG: zinc ribbon domain-containing protein [Anaerolineales bacterium]